MPRILTISGISLKRILTTLFIAITAAAPVAAENLQKLVIAGGCFWCVESDFESVKGVKEAVSGFTGGRVANPDYDLVKKGQSGHYEAVELTYDADVVGARQLYDLFFKSIDPLDAGGQFCDRGQPYRSAIFVANKAQKAAAETAKAAAQKALGRKIVTPILSFTTFYPAGSYHQNYYKSRSIVFTRFGPLTKASAYKKYRQACGRDDRTYTLWGNKAPFSQKYR